MDIQARKIHFVQEFLKLQNEELIKKLENLLKLEKMKSYESELSSMSLEQFNAMIDQAEEDAQQNRLTEASELRKNIDSWT